MQRKHRKDKRDPDEIGYGGEGGDQGEKDGGWGQGREIEGVVREGTYLNNSDFQNHVSIGCSQSIFEISKAGRKPEMKCNQK